MFPTKSASSLNLSTTLLGISFIETVVSLLKAALHNASANELRFLSTWENYILIRLSLIYSFNFYIVVYKYIFFGTFTPLQKLIINYESPNTCKYIESS